MGSTVSKPAPLSISPEAMSEKRVSPTPSVATSTTSSGRAPSAALVGSTLKEWETDFAGNPTLLLSQTILSHSDLPTSLFRRQATVNSPAVFNLSIKDESKIVTNQKSSGRCWLFATLNTARISIRTELNLPDEFELSQSYLYFYDKLEKANSYLENTIELVDEPLDSRIVTFLAQAPINDGGQQDMAASLIEHYGFIPQALYPESYSSSNSAKLNGLLTSYLRQSALGLRKMLQAGKSMDEVRRRKEQDMKHVWEVLAIALGTPPKPDEPFCWDFYDKDGKYQCIKMTPLEFSKKYGGKHPYVDSFSLIHDPRNAYDTHLTVDRLINIWGGRNIAYANVEIKVLEEAVIKSIKAGTPVFFGCDVGAMSARSGEMNLECYDYKLALGLDYTMTKAERLQTGDSAMTHAMVITAVHLDASGRAVRYRVENSWSDAAGIKGYMCMSAAWFEQYVYQVVVHKGLMPKQAEILKKEAKVLPSWDPLGALA